MILRSLGPRFIYPFAERYVGRDISAKRAEIQRRTLLAPTERAARVKEDLRFILEYAGAKVPYYRDLFKLKSFSPNKVLIDTRYLEEIPFLTKEIIREEGDRLISEEHVGNQWLHKRSTGGSTGQAVIIKYSLEDLDWTAAVNLSLDTFTQRKPHDLEVHFAALFEEQRKFIDRCYGMVKNISMNRRNIFIGETSDEIFEAVYRKLRWMNPYIVQAHPSTVYGLSLFVEKSGYLRKKPLFAALESTGEAIDRKQVAHIEKFLGCRIFNRYGSAEFGVVAHSRLNPFELEIIDCIAFPENALTSEGGQELVLTGLKNFAMPLIRYRTGDLATVSSHDSLPVLQEIEGRLHDFVKVNGRVFTTHFLQDVLDRVGGHREFQIFYAPETREVQRILIVPLDSGTNLQIFSDEIKKQLHEDIPLELVEYGDLKRVGIRDKFRRALPEMT